MNGIFAPVVPGVGDRGQDLIEYALMAGFVAVTAGAIMPGVSASISTIFSKIDSVIVLDPVDGVGTMPESYGPARCGVNETGNG